MFSKPECSISNFVGERGKNMVTRTRVAHRRSTGTPVNGSKSEGSLEHVNETKVLLSKEVNQLIAESFDALSNKIKRSVQRNAGENPSDYDTFYGCCQRLVKYITENMQTSPGFELQMDRIIQCCHTSANESSLGAVVTKDVWLRVRNESAAIYGKPANRNLSFEKTTNKKKRTVSPLSPPLRTKRIRQTLPKLELNDNEELVDDDEEDDDNSSDDVKILEVEGDDDDQEEEIEEEQEPKKIARRGKHTSARKSVPTPKSLKSKQPHLEIEDELLTFQDAIGQLCYPEHRTPSQTKFFKAHLRKAIQFVDAQLCSPHQNKVCARNCKQLRSIMCHSDQPCKNKTCRVWHDVEAHTDQCQNTHCEFRNRVMLRETMHKIDRQKQQRNEYRYEIQRKAKEIAAVKEDETSEREQFIEVTLLENEVRQLQRDLEQADEQLKFLKATKKNFDKRLAEIGVSSDADITDKFPDFETHYVPKKPSKKGKTTPRRSRTLASRVNRRAPRKERSRPSPNETSESDYDSAEASNIKQQNSTRNSPSGQSPPRQGRVPQSIKINYENDESAREDEDSQVENDPSNDRKKDDTVDDEENVVDETKELQDDDNKSTLKSVGEETDQQNHQSDLDEVNDRTSEENESDSIDVKKVTIGPNTANNSFSFDLPTSFGVLNREPEVKEHKRNVLKTPVKVLHEVVAQHAEKFEEEDPDDVLEPLLKGEIEGNREEKSLTANTELQTEANQAEVTQSLSQDNQATGSRDSVSSHASISLPLSL
jgi:hypothetical protein